MERLEVKLVTAYTTYINEWYIKVDQDGYESVWKKSTKVKDGQEEVLQNEFYHDASHRPNLQDPDEIHQYLVNFLHGIEDSQKEDIDPDDSFETIITFHDGSDPVYEVYEDTNILQGSVSLQDHHRKEGNIMKWTKEIHITGFRFVNKKFVEIRETVYKSDQGQVIVKDPHGGYWFENHWFHYLQDAKQCAEGR